MIKTILGFVPISSGAGVLHREKNNTHIPNTNKLITVNFLTRKYFD